MSDLGVDYGVPFVLEGPDGTRAVFNDDSDEDYVGILGEESSGLDSAEVRENAQDATEADGGVHGNFYYGRRPVILAGTVVADSLSDRRSKITKLKRASNALREDSSLTWEPPSGPEVALSLRRQQPIRVTGGVVKSFQVPLVSASAFIESVATHTKEFAENKVAFSVENAGDAEAAPTVVLDGPMTNPSIINKTTGKTLKISESWLKEETVTIDFKNHSISFNGEEDYNLLNFSESTWWKLAPGSNSIEVSASVFLPGEGAKITVEWKDAWV